MINLLTKTESAPKPDNIQLKTYNLLSIGQRGFGKTVFLAGSYAQFKAEAENNPLVPLWLECEAQEAQKNINNVLNYIARTGEYPPATMKITNFDFSLQQNRSWGKETVGRVCWWDTPGESCQIYNPAFLSMVVNAHGCCLFLDAQALVEQGDKPQELEALLNPIQTIAEIIHYNGLKHPLALILTKCDLLKAKAVNWQRLKKSLSPLTDYLSALPINYQTFYSEIPIEQVEGVATLKGTQTSMPLIWLVEEMKKADAALSTAIADDSPFKKAKLTEALSAQLHPLLPFTRSKFLAFLSLLLVASLVGLISPVFLSEQNHDKPLPTQPK